MKKHISNKIDLPKPNTFIVVSAVASDARGQLALSGCQVDELGVAEDHDAASLPCLVFNWIRGCGLDGFVSERGAVFRADGAKDRY